MAHYLAQATGMRPSNPPHRRERLLSSGASGIHMEFPWSRHRPSPAGGYAPGHAASLDSERLIRNVLFLGTLLLVWFTTDPFPDLGDPRQLDPRAHGAFLHTGP